MRNCAKPAQPRYQRDVVGNAIARILVGAEIDADDPTPPAPALQPLGKGGEAVTVEAEPIDHRPVIRQAEDARARIAGLRKRCDAPALDEAEAETEELVGYFALLVVAGCEPDRIGKAQAERLYRKQRIIRRGRQGGQQRKRANRGLVSGFGIECVQEGARQREQRSHHAGNSGNTCKPSAPSGRGPTEMTASRGEGSIEMGKKVTAARGLISQGVAEPCAVNSDQEKVILPGEMLRSGLAQLCGGGEVDEAVGEINGRPLETPRRLGLAPEAARCDLEDNGAVFAHAASHPPDTRHPGIGL